MDGDDETSMSTFTAPNEVELPVLKPLKTIWDCEFMNKNTFFTTWTCGHCDTTFKQINATKALAHVLSIPDSHVSSCLGGIARKYSIRYTNLYSKLSATAAGKKRGKIKITKNLEERQVDVAALLKASKASSSKNRNQSVVVLYKQL